MLVAANSTKTGLFRCFTSNTALFLSKDYSIFRELCAIQLCAVGEEAGDLQGGLIGGEGQVVVRLWLGRHVLVQGVIHPEAGVADIAGDTRQNVEGARLVPLEVLDVAAIAVRVEVRREHEVDA